MRLVGEQKERDAQFDTLSCRVANEFCEYAIVLL